jgi:hypothetical protein
VFILTKATLCNIPEDDILLDVSCFREHSLHMSRAHTHMMDKLSHTIRPSGVPKTAISYSGVQKTFKSVKTSTLIISRAEQVRCCAREGNRTARRRDPTPSPGFQDERRRSDQNKGNSQSIPCDVLHASRFAVILIKNRKASMLGHDAKSLPPPPNSPNIKGKAPVL